MNHLRALIFGLLLISGCGSGINPDMGEPGSSKDNQDPLTAIKISGQNYFYETKDTLIAKITNGIESTVVLGEMQIESVRYDVGIVLRKIEVADGYRGRSFITFKNRKEKITYEVWNGDISKVVAVHQNKLVILDDAGGSPCMYQIDSFPEQMVLDCDIGLLERQND